MDYPLENLGADRFQQFCQALLVTEFPRVQCFPVAQPDGGRDAVSYYLPDDSGKSMVFQVKFVKKPLAENDPHKWLLEIIKGELPKILELKKRGATHYVLITNIPATAHLDSGSIDKLNAIISEQTGLPSTCWWRDDVNRRLDINWAIKWAYPEIMTGPDFLRAIIESGVTEDKERRASAIKAFLRAQYEADEDVRFKQVDLQNKLFDLFIDVPIKFQDQHATVQQTKSFKQALAGYSQKNQNNDLPLIEAYLFASRGDLRSGDQVQSVGAAAFLLNLEVQYSLPQLVIEGAPGQGKSTITQYICQVHRANLLNKDAQQLSLSLLPTHKASRLPFRVDLRDLATWLSKKNPFSLDNQNVPEGWHKSLESFLAALVRENSGGTGFTSDDLLAVFRPSAVLLVFDGLDEVADVVRRQDIVDEITKGVQRLEENTASLQVIVTSRPAAFANSPGMPHVKYPYLQLESLGKAPILEYADRWLQAKKIDGKQGNEFKAILRDKLDQPHLRDLARNPMQLAILLSLILTRGASLPDKRTALYDFYIDLFFSRESEKSVVVRDHRQLLIDIHGYLGWLLHCESEMGEARASISEERLHTVLVQYLEREGHDAKLADVLFKGMVERVVAIVSRTLGTYEFEVQPLREYFAAYYLYDTAPPSSTGKERSGAKPDRFDALARNFYWLNVTRFFAGFYSKGELPSLIERLQELSKAENFKQITHPRLLTTTLLSDWVFNQNPRSIREAVSLTMDKGKVRYLSAFSNTFRYLRRNSGQAFSLPPKCGREELVVKCFEYLSKDAKEDFTKELLNILRTNSESPEDVRIPWLEKVNSATTNKSRQKWIRYGFDLNFIDTMPIVELENLLSQTAEEELDFLALYERRRFDFVAKNEQRFNATIDAILDRPAYRYGEMKTRLALDGLSGALDAYSFAAAFRRREPVPFELVLSEMYLEFSSNDVEESQEIKNFANTEKCLRIGALAEEQFRKSTIEWATTLEPWDIICEAARGLFGDKFAMLHFANVAAGIRSTSEQCVECNTLLDHSKSLCRRVRYARLRSGNTVWWQKQFKAAVDEQDLILLLLVVLSWAKNDTLLHLVAELEEALSRVSEENWLKIFKFSRFKPFHHIEIEDKSLKTEQIPQRLSERVAIVFAGRAKTVDVADFMANRYFSKPEELHLAGLEFALQGGLDLLRVGTKEWNPDLALIRRVYALGETNEPKAFQMATKNNSKLKMPLKVAKAIADDPLAYPGFLVVMSVAQCRSDMSKDIVAVSKVATKEKWFEA